MKFLQHKTVVVPFDYSRSSTAALDKTIEMAEDSTNILAIHVVAPTPVLVPYGSNAPIPPEYDQQRLRYAADSVREIFGSGQWARIEPACRLGDPGLEIVKFAKSVGADLIVVSSHGKSGLKEWLLGSVAERVLRLAHCSVLILRGEAVVDTPDSGKPPDATS